MQKKRIALLVVMVLLLTIITASGTTSDIIFTDVPANDWAATYIYDLVDRGVLSGYGDGTFGPNNTVERCEYAKMLVLISGTPINSSVATPYSDVPANEWFFPYINSSLSYITGFTDENGILEFRPVAKATREDVTVALIKALGTDISAYKSSVSRLSKLFTDIDTISAHNLPYIAAAVDMGYIKGDSEGTFRGQDEIIRSEVVAILCRAFPR